MLSKYMIGLKRINRTVILWLPIVYEVKKISMYGLQGVPMECMSHVKKDPLIVVNFLLDSR